MGALPALSKSDKIGISRIPLLSGFDQTGIDDDLPVVESKIHVI